MAKLSKQSRQAGTGKSGVQRASVLIVTVVLTLGIFTVAIFLRAGESDSMGSPRSPLIPSGSQPATVAVAANAGFQPLHGRWLRPDGGYILDIRGVGATGTVEAVYLNPNPITIARAEAIRDSSMLKVVAELRAPGCPGSTYTLTYDPIHDQLAGIYFQAALQHHFDVVFVRMK
jgi:hypothetical protein